MLWPFWNGTIPLPRKWLRNDGSDLLNTYKSLSVTDSLTGIPVTG